MIRLGVGLLLGALVVFATTFWLGPAVWRDVQIRQAGVVPAFDLRVEKADCRVIGLFVVSSCTVKYRNEATAQSQSLYYAFLGRLSEKQVFLMRSARDRDAVTANVGIDHIWNRAFACALLMLGGSLILFANFRRFARA
jgi:hypothetical protein